MAKSPVDLTKSSAAGSLMYDLAKPLFEKGGEKILKGVETVGGGLFNAARDAAYDRLTDVERREAKPSKDGKPDLTYGGLRTGGRGGKGTDWSQEIQAKQEEGKLGAARGQRDPRTGVHSGIDYRRGVGDKADEFLAHFTKTNVPNFFGSKTMFNNPEAVADLAGMAGVGIPALGAVGLGLYALGKPETEYSVPVQPSGGYSNQSVESAMASAGAKYELEEQKFQHNMALAQMREQSRIPGVQNTSVGAYGGSGMTSSAVMGLMQNQFGNTRKYF